MAKKKQESPAILTMFQAISRSSKFCDGLGIPYFALRYLADKDAFPFGQIIQLVGEPSSGKSRMLYEMCRWAISAGGYGIIVETERKSEIETTIRSAMGDEAFYSGRFIIIHASSLDGPEDDQGRSSMQVYLAQVLETIKSDPLMKDAPVVIGVDSLLGGASADEIAAYEEGAGNMNDSAMTYARRAGSLGKFVKKFQEDLSGTKIVAVFVNHGKTKMLAAKPGMAPEQYVPGGKDLQFASTTIFWFTKGKPAGNVDRGGRVTWVKTNKSSNGDDARSIPLAFYYKVRRDAEGNAVLDDGFPVRDVLWDWDAAAAEIFKNIVGGLKGAPEASKKQLSKVLPKLSFVGANDGTLVTCEARGIKDMPLRTFGRLLTTDHELYRDVISGIDRLNIQHIKGQHYHPRPMSFDSDIANGEWGVLSDEGTAVAPYHDDSSESEAGEGAQSV